MFVKKPNNQVKSIGIRRSQMLKDLAAAGAVQRQKQDVKRSTRTHSFGSEVEENAETPRTKNEMRKLPRKQMMVERSLRKAIAHLLW